MLRMSGMLVAFALVGSLIACKGDAKPAAPALAPVTTGTVGSDGVRRIPVEANIKGYQPDRIAAKPGEHLVLVVTRTVESSCLAQIKTPDGKLIDLPKGVAVEVALTAPATGELAFTCGMDMFRGAIVATTSS